MAARVKTETRGQTRNARSGLGRSRPNWVAVGAVVVGVALVAIVLTVLLRSTGGSGQAAAQPASGGALAPDVKAQLIDGGTFTLSEQRGKPVLMIFTASWCSPCIPEVNKMAQLQDEFGSRGLKQIAISVDPTDTPSTFARLRQATKGSNILWGLDPGQQATLAYGIRATDTKVLIDPAGREVDRIGGPMSVEDMRQRISAMLS